jgi:hypothetical protein
MMTTKLTLNIMKKIKKQIFDYNFLESNRVSKKTFTRNRKLPFSSLILFMINLVKQTLQKELTQFIQIFSKNKFENISKSAFCQSRLNLKPEAFKQLNQTILDEFYKNSISYKTWNNFRILSIDGSTTQLPISSKIISHFGVAKNHTPNEIPIARISTLFDVLNNKIVDSQINKFEIGEYDLALNHLNFINKNDLLLADRGYGAIWLFQYTLSLKSNFVIRISKTFLKKYYNKLLKSSKFSMVINIDDCTKKSKLRLEKLGLKFNSFSLRLVKVILDSGEVEILATSLVDEKKFPCEIFKELYFKRWGIETNYGHLKQNIQIENFTGKSVISIEQDFYASCFISNLQSLIINDVQEELIKEGKETKYMYKINQNLSLGFLKHQVVKIILGENQKENYEKLKKLFQIEKVPIRKNRKFPRKKFKRRKYPMNAKKAI